MPLGITVVESEPQIDSVAHLTTAFASHRFISTVHEEDEDGTCPLERRVQANQQSAHISSVCVPPLEWHDSSGRPARGVEAARTTKAHIRGTFIKRPETRRRRTSVPQRRISPDSHYTETNQESNRGKAQTEGKSKQSKKG